MAGAPKLEETFVRGVPLWIGSLIHEDIHRMLRKAGVPYMAEVDVTPWLPAGWAGTLDALVWHPELEQFVLRDFKSTRGSALRYLASDGPKVAHVKQTSAYYHAVRKMGLPLAEKVEVYYLPKDGNDDPLTLDFDPIPADVLHTEMQHRLDRVNEYRESLAARDYPPSSESVPSAWVTDALEPVQAREQTIKYDPKTETWDVILKPNWSVAYCPFPNELCDCRTQGQTKLGMWDVDGTTWVPRSGYEDIEPTVRPS